MIKLWPQTDGFNLRILLSIKSSWLARCFSGNFIKFLWSSVTWSLKYFWMTVSLSILVMTTELKCVRNVPGFHHLSTSGVLSFYSGSFVIQIKLFSIKLTHAWLKKKSNVTTFPRKNLRFKSSPINPLLLWSLDVSSESELQLPKPKVCYLH